MSSETKTLARSFTTKIKRGLSIRSSILFDSERPVQKPNRPTISLPLEHPDVDIHLKRTHASHILESATSGWITLPSAPSSPTSSSSSSHSSCFSSPASSRASSSSRTSYNSGDNYFPPLNIKKVSFSEMPTVRRRSCGSAASSLYAPEGELPPPLENDEHILAKIGINRFAAAEYIEEIEGTPMILVDGKLYL